jgi:hypothetical protein
MNPLVYSLPTRNRPVRACYGNIPLRTNELFLGLQTPLPRQKITFGHYHSYKFILSIMKERRKGSRMYVVYNVFPSCSNLQDPNSTYNG